MSSSLRSTYTLIRTHTQFVGVESPSYEDSSLDDAETLFPFVVRNGGVLDIEYMNSFEQDMIDDLGNAPRDDTELSTMILSNPILVTSIGDNLKEYIRSWKNLTIDASSPITLFQPCRVIKVQQINYLNINEILVESNNPPAGQWYSTDPHVKCIFASPLTIVYKASGVNKYITLYSKIFED
jgi:hypothetical protein